MYIATPSNGIPGLKYLVVESGDEVIVAVLMRISAMKAQQIDGVAKSGAPNVVTTA